jgi:hypothetical protein
MPNMCTLLALGRGMKAFGSIQVNGVVDAQTGSDTVESVRDDIDKIDKGVTDRDM